MKITIRKNRSSEFGFKYLWLIILAPKVLQFAIYLIWILILALHNHPKKTREMRVLLGFVAIHFLSIVWQLMLGNVSILDERFFAAINTVLIWFISVASYGIFANRSTPIKIERISKYMMNNLLILFCIYLIYKTSHLTSFTVGPLHYYLSRADYLETGRTTRFVGLMENVVGVTHLFCLAFPISLLSVKKIKSIILKAIYCIICYIPVIECHSRIGIIVGGIMTLFGIIFLLYDQKTIKRWQIVCVICMSLAFLLFYTILSYRDFISEFLELANSRTGSNSTRMAIYSESIAMTVKESILIGIGVKYMRGHYPYGSHSTYIGVFYKTGIIGSFFFVSALFALLKKLIQKAKSNRSMILIILMDILYFAILVLTDLDGSNWYIVTRFILWALLIYQCNSIDEI